MADDEKKKEGKAKGKKGKAKQPEPVGPTKDPKEPVKEDFKYIVRIAETDLDGYKSVELALTRIRGVGRRTAIVITDLVGVPRSEKIGNLEDEQISALANALTEHQETAPSWMMNRQADVDTGDDLHLFASELMAFFRDDINRLKKIRCYRGMRHEKGKKVRGQRTRSNGRKGLTLGVMKAGKGGAQAAPAKGAKGASSKGSTSKGSSKGGGKKK